MTETDAIAPQSTAGERLRAAREEKGLTLEEVATQTRIPRRHLENLEAGNWQDLPAPTYTIGFAKSYASAVGLDRTEIGDQLKAEMGGAPRETSAAEVFEPADPARTMPKSLVIGAIAAVLLLVLVMSWLSNRSLEPAAEPEAPASASTAPGQVPAPAQPGPAPAPAPAQGPVVLTATGEAWIRVTDQGRTLFEGVLQPGQRYEVPATATAPLLRVGAPEALRISVGTAVAPPVGPPGQVTSNVSLAPADLMRAGAQPQAGPALPAPSAPPGVQNRAP